MTHEEAKLAVSAIREIAIDGDDDLAHVREDRLRRDALREIADNQQLTLEQTRQLAAIALSTECLDFSRWCA
jgi:hypothetical protein